MPFLVQYLIKFSISLAVLYTFYFLVLRPLTFYQWNRFYLLCYSLLSFIIPFINITPWIPATDIEEGYIMGSILVVENITSHSFSAAHNAQNIFSSLISWNFIGWLFLSGALVMLSRIIYQYLSLRSIKSKAVLLKTGEFEFYDVDGPISPFSFANAIFINSRLHTEEEFHRILEHEFVHVKQKHTIDIVVAELICVLNWFNPFAWMIRKTIRQNLEFIADNNVLEGGIDARKYQYLLLKVMGLPQYSIANNFSFSSLKKRIAMMNKIKSARVHLVKFLFVLPLLAVMLLAFRDNINSSNPTLTYTGIGSDTVPVMKSKPAVIANNGISQLANPAPALAAAVHQATRIAPSQVASPAKVTAAVPQEPAKLAQVGTQQTAIRYAGTDTVPARLSEIVIRRSDNIKDKEPLYIVDHEIQPSGMGIDNIPPESIAAINVLKGENAIALYGSRASNGVIDITTKEGYANKKMPVTPQSVVTRKTPSGFKGKIFVDGIESTNEKVASLDPSSIESISVFKNKPSDFYVERDSPAESILRKLPDIDIDSSGKLSAQGQAVQKVFVDGVIIISTKKPS